MSCGCRVLLQSGGVQHTRATYTYNIITYRSSLAYITLALYVYVYGLYNIIIIVVVRCERQRRYVHGRPSAYKRTGGRKVYDFIGRVGQLSLRQFDVPVPPRVLLSSSLCVYIRTGCIALTQSGIGTSGRRSPDHAHITICTDDTIAIIYVYTASSGSKLQ